MERRDFGAWGFDLTEVEFAKALASRGVLHDHPQIRDDAAQIDAQALLALLRQQVKGRRSELISWQLPAMVELSHPVPADVFADAWSKMDCHVSRIEVQAFPGHPLWLVSQLTRPEIGAESVYVRRDAPPARVTWEWPLRVAVLGDKPSSRFSAEMREYGGWVPNLLQHVEPSRDPDACELLLLPYDLSEALSHVLQGRRLAADLVVVFGRPGPSQPQTWKLIEALRSTVHTAGVVLAPVEPEAQLKWIVMLVRELSHNQPLDRALFGATTTDARDRLLLVASRHLIDRTRLSERVRELGELLRQPHLRDVRIKVDEGSIAYRGLEIPSGEVRLDRVGEELETRSEQEYYDHETDMGSVAAEVITEAGRAAAEAPSVIPEPPARFLQAQVLDATDPDSPVLRRNSFRAGATHNVCVFVGIRRLDWIPPQGSERFPDEKLPPGRDRYELRVVFTEPLLLREPQVDTIVLPANKDSTECTFFIHVPVTAEKVEARVIVSHENRVLQTALLKGSVGEAEDRSPDAGSIRLQIEALVRPDLGELYGRRRFDAALVLNHDDTGRRSVTKLADDHAAVFVSDDLDDEIDWFEQRLTEVAVNREDFSGGLKADATVELLRDFAKHGRLLYEHIVTDSIGDESLATGDRLQVVATRPDQYLPLEFVYERKAPSKNAELCLNAADALRAGRCSDNCLSGEDERSVICPLAFWCMRKVIERHAHDPKLARQVGPADFALQSEPSRFRSALPLLLGGLVAGSAKVDQAIPQGLSGLRKTLDSATAGGTELVDTWGDWEDRITSPAPVRSLLLLLVHTERVAQDDPMQKMEIGSASWLETVELGDEHVRPSPDRSPPLVLLLGCQTGSPEISLHSLVAQFRRKGAAIVVSTGAKIHSVHAVPVAEEFIKLMETVAIGPETSFGDVMLLARREMLARGLPMVLCLTAYGDADWRL